MLLYDFLAQPKWRSNEDFNTKDTTEGKAAKTTKKKKVERLAVGSARFPSRLFPSL